MSCSVCGSDDTDTRMGVCFDCATAGEARAARRGVLGHIWRGIDAAMHAEWWVARICFRWAWERLTKTGDYAPGGEFDAAGYDWR